MKHGFSLANWLSTKARRALAALLRIGWRIKRQTEEIGQWTRKFGASIYGTRAGPVAPGCSRVALR